MSAPQYDAAVVGGGPIGLAGAWRAAQQGLRVVVLDREDPHGAAWPVSAGMLAPVTEAQATEAALADRGLESARRWPAFAEELAGASGRDPGYRRPGTLAVARDRDEAEALDRERAIREELGMPVRRLLASRARRLEPALAPTLRLALEVEEDHAVDPRALRAALAGACEAAGVELRPAEAVAVAPGEVRLAGGERVAAATVVLAAGAWSARLVPEPARVPLRPVKGQALRLRDPAGPGLLDRVVRLQDAYIVPRGDGEYVLGATVEERGFDTAVTAVAVWELLRDAAEVVPGLLELEVVELGAGLRPTTPDNAPVLGPAALDGVVWATGHYRNGVLLTPLTADLLAAGLVGGEWPADLSPGRFAPAGRGRPAEAIA